MKRIFAILLCAGASAHAALIQIVTDNDFALLTGTATSITRLVYQSDVEWPTQISNASSFDLSLAAGENTIYILAMGGGGDENVSGRINGIDISTLSNLQMSTPVQGYLSGYNPSDVAAGTYNASLPDLQNAMPNLTWFTPTPGSGGVIEASGFALGYPFADSSAVLLRFGASDVGVPDGVPEPSALSLLAIGLGGLAILRRRRL